MPLRGLGDQAVLRRDAQTHRVRANLDLAACRVRLIEDPRLGAARCRGAVWQEAYLMNSWHRYNAQLLSEFLERFEA